MREISPSVKVSVEEFIKRLPPEAKAIVEEIRRQKQACTRPLPSTSLIDCSSLLTWEHRRRLIDAVAALTDENYAGRSEMCKQFGNLLHRALNYLGLLARPVVGWAIYYGPSREEIFRWQHVWVRVGEEVIDGNVDSLSENPLVPKTVRVAPYWGRVKQVPADRRLREEYGTPLDEDDDVLNIWWPELKGWLEREFPKT